MRDYPQLSIGLPPEVKATLHALSIVNAQPQWRLIASAVECYLNTQPDREQRLVAKLVRRVRSRADRKR